MKQTKELNITHELIITNTEFYKYSVSNLKKIIAYLSVKNFEMDNWDGIPMIKVTGTRILCGYYIANRGFYDVINDVFYHQEYLDNNECEIRETKEAFVKKLVK